jgi:hypothetical protein
MSRVTTTCVKCPDCGRNVRTAGEEYCFKHRPSAKKPSEKFVTAKKMEWDLYWNEKSAENESEEEWTRKATNTALYDLINKIKNES